MYNKLFSKILDSSIWLESTETRIVWITLIAAMDQDGFAAFSAIENLARRAGVTVTQAEAAVIVLLNPDVESGDPDFGGRRIERVPGGFIVLNAIKYREISNDANRREQTRLRVAAHRERLAKLKACNVNVTHSNAESVFVTPASASASECIKSAKTKKMELPGIPEKLNTPEFVSAWSRWLSHRKEIGHPIRHTMAENQFKRFAEIGIPRAIRMIEYTITEGWQGLREPDKNSKLVGNPAAAKRATDEQIERTRSATKADRATAEAGQAKIDAKLAGLSLFELNELKTKAIDKAPEGIRGGLAASDPAKSPVLRALMAEVTQ